MKIKKYFIIFPMLILAVLLTSCGSMLTASSWPGIAGDDEMVFVAYANSVYSIRLKDGNLNWKYPEKAEATKTFFAQPLLLEDQLLLGDYLKNFYSLNPENGTEQWTFTEAKNRYIGGALAVDDLVIVPNADHSLYALDLEGNLVWSFTAEHALWSTPLTDGEVIYVASMDHNVYALSQDDGQEVWKVDLGGSIVYRPALTSDGILVAATLNEIIAIDTSNASEVWRMDVPDSLWSEPIEHEGNIYFGDSAGRIYALDAKDGSLVWDYTIDQLIAGAAAVIPQGIVFSGEQGKVIALDFNGELLWTRQFEGKLYTGPVVADGMLVLGIVGGDNLIVAMNYEGSEVWTFTPDK